jgi:hypothetical protein
VPISTDINELVTIIAGLTIKNHKLEVAMEQLTAMHNTVTDENIKLKEELASFTNDKKVVEGDFKKAE